MATCINCKKSLKNEHAKRCKSCDMKLRWTQKIWNDKMIIRDKNKKKTLRFCIDCETHISRSYAIRCKSCEQKFRMKNQEYKNKCVPWINDPTSHPSYVDGRSGDRHYPIEFINKREKIFKRDEYRCQNCGMVEEEHIIVYGQRLEVHHIDYDKFNNSDNNLITTCKGCNIRANFNRESWKIFYNEKMKAFYVSQS